MSTYVSVEISPETTTRPVFTSVSQATRPVGSSRMTASRTPSEIWSATLSGWPSVTDSEVNRYSFSESGWFIGERGAADVQALQALLLAPVVIDHHRHALEAVAPPKPVLEEEAVITREEPLVRHLDGEARRA